MRFTLVSFFFCICLIASGEEARRLTGSVICDNTISATQTMQFAFDQDYSTKFVSDSISHAWVGLDLLDSTYVITKIGISIGQDQHDRTMLGLFEGANHPDFTDAVPLHLLQEPISSGTTYFDIDVTRAFRYVRYVGPHSSNGEVAEIEFWGYSSSGSDDHFYQLTNLPTMVIHTQSGSDPIDKITDLTAIATLIYSTNKGNTKLIGDSCVVRGRGNQSWKLDKKPLRIKFNHKIDMPKGGTKAKKWTLIPNHGDKTLMRNILAFDMSQRLEMPYTPYCQPVDVILNGEYQGTYNLCDQLEVGKNRIDIDEIDHTITAEPELSGGYFFEYDGSGCKNMLSLSDWINLPAVEQRMHDVGFFTDATNPVTIKSPDEKELRQEHVDYLTNYVNTLEQQIFNTEDSLFDYLDLQTFSRFFLVNEFIGNTDTFYELYFSKKRGDKRAYAGPCWDNDLAYDNDRRSHEYLETIDAKGWLFQMVDDEKNGGTCIEDIRGYGQMRNMANAIVNREKTIQCMEELWAYYRASNIICKDTLLQLVETTADSLRVSQRLNFLRWPILDTLVHQNYQALGSYDAEVSTISTYIPRRLDWFDRQLNIREISFDLTISAAKWATIYLPYAFKVPEQLQCYTVVGIGEDTQLLLEPVVCTLPNQPYLVHSPPGTYHISGFQCKDVDGNTNGLLTGTNHTIQAPIGSYVLQWQNWNPAFYLVSSENPITIGANKAYLQYNPNDGLHAPNIQLQEHDANIITKTEKNHISFIYKIDGTLLCTIEAPDKDGLSLQSTFDKLSTGIYIVVYDSGRRELFDIK